MVEIKYIGEIATKVRVNGIKIDIEPNEVFEMEDKQANDLLNSFAYRHLFIKNGAELTTKQNKNNLGTIVQNIVGLTEEEQIEISADDIKKILTEKGIKFKSKASKQDLLELLESIKEETTDVVDNSEIIEKIQNAESIDALNEIATDVANDEILSENEEVNEAIETKMAEFLAGSDDITENIAPQGDIETKDETIQAPVVEDTEKSKKKAV